MRITPLFSGSSGNVILVESEGARILVDAGVTARKTGGALSELGLTFSDIDAIFITHEHSDHIAGLGVISRRKEKIPVYMNERTRAAIAGKKDGPGEKLVRVFETGEEISVNGVMGVKAFHTSHDAADPVGYIFTDGKLSAGLATDTGYVTPGVRENLMKCGVIFFESNHDVDMLMGGPYPAVLKERIRSDHGHLSNSDCASALSSFISEGCCEKIILGHLSKENNNPMTALNTSVSVLKSSGMERGRDYLLNIARRDGMTDPFEI